MTGKTSKRRVLNILIDFISNEEIYDFKES